MARPFPVLFVSHGAPDILLQRDPVIDEWRAQVVDLPRPERILVVSAHWETPRFMLGGNAHGRTLHDFYGFPEALYRYRYAPPADVTWADELARNLGVDTDHSRGLDHGAWVPLVALYPEAEIPVSQLSVAPAAGLAAHYRLGRLLAPLRHQGVLILASGVIVHNLRELDWHDPFGAPDAWAQRFMASVDEAVVEGCHEQLLEPQALPGGSRALPSLEHFLPLLIACGAAGEEAEVRTFASAWRYRNLSQHSYRFE